MEEKEYIYNLYVEKFLHLERPIVLYSTGINTKYLLSKLDKHNIVGVMDKEKTGVFYKDINILSYEDVLRLGVKDIVITARHQYHRIICQRIAKFCNEHQITVWNIEGDNLEKLCKTNTFEHPYFEMNWNDLYMECQDKEIVTFDVFDTLITRRCLFPADIFEIMERKIKNEFGMDIDFVETRKKCEYDLYERGKNPTIYDIYDDISLALHLNKEQRNQILLLEIETEKNFIVPKKVMLSFFEEMKRKKKKIYLISDMYLPKEILTDILDGCGCKGYDELFVSCDHGVGKTNGLFEIVKEKIGQTQSWIHIGDSEVADIQAARKSDIEAFYVMKAYDILINSTYCQLLDIDMNILDKIIIGQFIYEAFSDPFVMYHSSGKLFIDNEEKLYELFLTPMVVYFSIWFINCVIQDKYDCVLFTARDGYLIRKIVHLILYNQRINNFPDEMYFYASRRATLTASSQTIEDLIFEAHRPFGGKIRDMMATRFNLQLQDGVAEELWDANNFDVVDTYIKKYKDEILDICAAERDNYKLYVRKHMKTGKKNIALFDFVAVGSVQLGLEKIFGEYDFTGLYFLKINDYYAKDIKTKSMFSANDIYRLDTNLYTYYVTFEAFFTSFEPSLERFSINGEPIFSKDNRNVNQLEIVKRVHEYILQVCAFISCNLCDLLNLEVHENVANTILGFFDEAYTNIDLEKIKIYVDDDFMNYNHDVTEMYS